MPIEEELQKVFIEKEMTLSVAESCTGGAISAKLTKIPDSSRYFLGGVVAYSNSLKVDLLNVPSMLIEKSGAVSPETARAMLQGILEVTASDYGIAVTGIAGPSGGTYDKPVGTVWIAVGRRGEEPKVWNLEAEGSRKSIINQTVEASLNQVGSMIFNG